MNYKIEGTPNSPVLIFSNSLGSELAMWDELVPMLLPYFRVLRYDTRGHGGSKANTNNATNSISELGDDVIGLMDSLGIESAYFCGLSLGGLIGQSLAITYPQRIKKLVLANTATKIGSEEGWNARIQTIKAQGMQAIVDDTMNRWFTEAYRISNPTKVEEARAMFLRSDVDGYTNCCYAIRDANFEQTIKNCQVETLVITGDQDPVTGIKDAEFLVENIPNATLHVLPTRHLSAVEKPHVFAQTLIDFFVGSEIQQKGMHIRRTVLGDDHVDNANSKKNSFNTDFQAFVTKYAWGEIWARPQLSKPNRSLITIAMLIALNRQVEFKMHIKAAIHNGVTVDEIKEVIMHAALYCGLPAANEALHAAEEVFINLGIKI
ncbi:MAG TPA: 3-oxoadipate enol-lactonase [Saprospiraceae bacterium]|nr:3-oxoadipate enol-lactonase [Saprospiraceae bacterium]